MHPLDAPLGPATGWDLSRCAVVPSLCCSRERSGSLNQYDTEPYQHCHHRGSSRWNTGCSCPGCVLPSNAAEPTGSSVFSLTLFAVARSRSELSQTDARGCFPRHNRSVAQRFSANHLRGQAPFDNFPWVCSAVVGSNATVALHPEVLWPGATGGMGTPPLTFACCLFAAGHSCSAISAMRR